MVKRCKANYNVVDCNLPPFKHNLGDAGYDMYSTKDVWIFPFMVRKVPVNMKCEIPEGHYGYTTSRSGETLKGNVLVPGIIDSTYRGAMCALMTRIGLFPRKIKKGTRIAQLIIQPYIEVDWIKTDILTNTLRGEKGFGNSGVA